MLRRFLVPVADRGPVGEGLLFMLIGAVVFGGWVAFEMLRDPFIRVESVIVEPSFVGEDPDVTYIREVMRDTEARWEVDIVGTSCEGAGFADYVEGYQVLEWSLFGDYIGSACEIGAGAYVMRTCYSWFYGMRETCAHPVPVIVREPAPGRMLR